MVTESSVPTTRKEREREQHRREILAAAEKIFGLKGYHAATVEEIAKEAEFAVGTLYNLFQSKEDLYAQCIVAFAEEFIGAFEQTVLSEQDPEQAIAAMIELRLTHFDQHRQFIRIALEAMPGGQLDPSKLMPPRVVEIHDRHIAAVTELFRRGMEAGKFDRADPLYLALMLEGIIHAFVVYWSKHEPVEPVRVRVEKMKREFLQRIKVRLGEYSQALE